MTEPNPLEIVIDRLKGKREILNITHIVRTTNVPRAVVEKCLDGEEPNTSYQNIIALYHFIIKNNV